MKKDITEQFIFIDDFCETLQFFSGKEYFAQAKRVNKGSRVQYQRDHDHPFIVSPIIC